MNTTKKLALSVAIAASSLVISGNPAAADCGLCVGAGGCGDSEACHPSGLGSSSTTSSEARFKICSMDQGQGTGNCTMNTYRCGTVNSYSDANCTNLLISGDYNSKSCESVMAFNQSVPKSWLVRLVSSILTFSGQPS